MAAEKQIHNALNELGSAAQAQETPAGLVDRALSRVNEAEQPGGLSMSWKRAVGERWRPRRLALAATAAGAVALVVGLGVSALSPSGDGGVAQAATVLRDAAKVAATQPQMCLGCPGVSITTKRFRTTARFISTEKNGPRPTARSSFATRRSPQMRVANGTEGRRHPKAETSSPSASARKT